MSCHTRFVADSSFVTIRTDFNDLFDHFFDLGHTHIQVFRWCFTPPGMREKRATDRQRERQRQGDRDREPERKQEREERRERKGVVEGEEREFKVTVCLRYVRAFCVWASDRESERVRERGHKYAYHDTQTHILDRVFSRAETLYNRARHTCFCQCHLLIFRILNRVLACYLILFPTWYLWL